MTKNEKGNPVGWSKAARRRAQRWQPSRASGKERDDDGNCLGCGLDPRRCDCN